MNFDPDELLEATGIETRLGGAPNAEPPLSSVGAQAQIELVRCLGALSASVEMLAVVVRDRPNDDASFDTLNIAFGQRLEEARAALLHFYNRRECRGEG